MKNTIEVAHKKKVPSTAFSTQSNLIDFDQCVHFLNRGGKAVFGDHFHIHPEDHQTVFLLLVYFFQDMENAERFGINIKKGLLLQGPVGCGKTSLMHLMKYLLQTEKQYTITSTRDIQLEFIVDGYKVIDKYAKNSFYNLNQVLHPKVYCFDDLGLESDYRHYGNQVNIMGEILLSRYPLFVYQQMKTHATTNLSALQLQEVYGNRIRSRMREMFNLITFGSKTVDKRR